MSKTRVFVSSTCYDLAAIREDLREHIATLGHEPLLSEYPSFPVSPDETAVANCKKNIEKHTDILVLIVGGRRGSLDEASGRSITNLEYETARRNNIPCFVFISRSVNTLLHVWKKNPDADFTPSVDNPEVFEFIERINAENHWTYTFEKTREIKDTLTLQFSTLLRELLERQMGGKLSPVAGFESETPEAQRLAKDKPDYWEFLLAAELIEAKLNNIAQKHSAVLADRFYQQGHAFDEPADYLSWISGKMSNIGAIAEALEKQLPLISISFGPPEVAGNVYHIQQRVDELVEIAAGFVEWEKEIGSVQVPDVCERLKATTRGWSKLCLKELRRLSGELRAPIKNGPPKHDITVAVDLKFEVPDLRPFSKEVKKVQRKIRWGF